MEFLVTLLGLAVAVSIAMNVQLAGRLRRLEQRLASGFTAQPGAVREAGQPADATQQAQARPEPASLANLFETLVGGRLLIWVGGVALVVAAVFLIRYSIEIGLITPELRMAAAALFGLLLLGLGEWAHRARRLADDPRVSQALVGAGLAVLYLTVYGSYLLWGFIEIGIASGLMLAITALALGLSLRHGVGTAALGLIGGFLTPWLIGQEDAGALPLLAYLALLDVAVFAIAWRRGWGWLAGVAVLASFAWTGFLLFGPAPDAIAGTWFAVVLGIIAAMLRPAGTSLTWIQPIAIAAVQVVVLAARGDVGTAGWLAYAAIAIAAVAVTRYKQHPPAVPLLVLVLGLLLLPVRYLFQDESGLVSAAIGMTLLFGAGAAALAMERKSGWWALVASAGFAGPVLVMRWTMPELLQPAAWGALQALMALGPVALVFTRQADRGGARVDFLSLVPAGAAAALLALGAIDLVPADGLSIAWLVLAILFIAGGMGLRNFPLRIAGLVLLTVTVVKLFVIDTWGLSSLLRILSFLGLGVTLIVLGRFYGTLLKRETKAVRPAAEAPG